MKLPSEPELRAWDEIRRLRVSGGLEGGMVEITADPDMPDFNRIGGGA